MPTVTIPNTTETTVLWDRSGLAGTIGVRVINNEGGTTLPRTTLAIIEYPAASGIYSTVIPDQAIAGQYTIVWDDGARFDAIDLLVLPQPIPPPPPDNDLLDTMRRALINGKGITVPRSGAWASMTTQQRTDELVYAFQLALGIDITFFAHERTQSDVSVSEMEQAFHTAMGVELNNYT